MEQVQGVSRKPVVRQRNRWLILVAAAITGCFTGSIYMWSIFNAPLMSAHGWSLQQVAFAYSLFILVDSIAGVFVGGLQRRFRTSRLLLVAGLLFGFGWFATGFARSIGMLYFTYCFVAAIGSGFIYNITVSMATKWFPDKKGFANGVCIGCVGLSSIAFAPLGNFLIESFGAESSFRVFGVLVLLTFMVFAWFVDAPEPGWRPEGYDPSMERDAQNAAGESKGFESTVAQALRSSLFWIAWVAFACAAMAGNMVSAHASDMGQALAHMTASQGALMVSLFAVGNFSGRLGFGFLSDRIGCCRTMMLVLFLCAADMLLLVCVSSFAMFAVAIFLSGLCLGGILTPMPSLCARLFGYRNFSQIYAILLLAFTFASFAGPQLAALAFTSFGDYDVAFFASAFASLIAIGLIALVSRKGGVR